MLKKIFLFACVATFFVGCTKEISEQNIVSDSLIKTSFEAETSTMTKVSYTLNSGETAYNCSWKEGDKVSLITEGNSNAEFTKMSGSNQFSGSVHSWTDKDIYCVWPYSSKAYTISDGKLSFDASTQTIKAGDTNYDSSIMVAMGEGSFDAIPTMSFHQAMAIIKMNITNVPAGTYVIKAAIINQSMSGNQTLTRSADINMSDGTISNPKNTSIVSAEVSGASKGLDTKINFAVLPTTTAGKYSFTITLSDGRIFKKTLSAAVAFNRNTIYTIDYDLATTAEEDLIFMVVYEETGCLEISGHQYKMTAPGSTKAATPSLYTSECFGLVNRARTNSDICNVPITPEALKNGYTVECYFVPVDMMSSREHKAIGFTYSAGACCGYSVQPSAAKVEADRTKCFVYANQYTGTSDEENTYWLHGVTYPTVTGKTPTAGQWVHLVYTWDKVNGKLKLYDDKTLFTGSGVEYPSSYHAVEDCNSFTKSSITQIGVGGNWNSTSILSGYSGPVRVWNRSLTETEIKALFDAEPPGLATETSWKKNGNYNLDIEIVAHRGAWSAGDNGGTATTENSRASLIRAIELDADYSECDVECSKDGYLVIQHDATTGRCCNENYPIRSTNYNGVLDKVKLKNGESLPLLDDFIRIVKDQPKDGHLTKLRIEIKNANATDKILQLITENDAEDLCDYITILYSEGTKIRNYFNAKGKAQTISTFNIPGDCTTGFFTYTVQGFNSFTYQTSFKPTAESVAFARSNGLTTTSGLANTLADMEYMMIVGCDACCTEEVLLLKNLISEFKGLK